MKTVVVDTSIALKWVLVEPDSPVARALLAEWIDKEMVIFAPKLLAYEVSNSLYRKARKGEMTLDAAKLGLTKILSTGLEFDSSSSSALNVRAMEIAEHFNLPATYDAHYVALAEREKCELWTADTKMWRAVQGKITWVRNLGEHTIAVSGEKSDNDVKGTETG